jgi:hypothetical protein
MKCSPNWALACVLGCVVLCTTISGHATTPEAWASFGEEVTRACLRASHLQAPRAAGERIDFDDKVGVSVLVLEGRYPQPHMHRQRGRELCIFDRRTRTVSIATADGILAPSSGQH